MDGEEITHHWRKTRQAIAFEQIHTRRAQVIVYAGAFWDF